MHIFNTKHVKHGAIRARGPEQVSQAHRDEIMCDCVTLVYEREVRSSNDNGILLARTSLSCDRGRNRPGIPYLFLLSVPFSK